MLCACILSEASGGSGGDGVVFTEGESHLYIGNYLFFLF